MPETACSCCFSDDRDVVWLRKAGGVDEAPEYWCAQCLETLTDVLRREEVGPQGWQRCYEGVKAANAPRMSRDDVIREMLEALEQALGALPDAWFAMKCAVPQNVIDAVKTAIEHGKQAVEDTSGG